MLRARAKPSVPASMQRRSGHKSSTQPNPRQERGPSATACEVVSAAHSLNHGLKELERDCGTERGDTPLKRGRTHSGILGSRFLDPRPVRCRCHCTGIWLAYYEKSDEICSIELLNSAMYFSQQHDGAEVSGAGPQQQGRGFESHRSPETSAVIFERKIHKSGFLILEANWAGILEGEKPHGFPRGFCRGLICQLLPRGFPCG